MVLEKIFPCGFCYATVWRISFPAYDYRDVHLRTKEKEEDEK